MACWHLARTSCPRFALRSARTPHSASQHIPQQPHWGRIGDEEGAQVGNPPSAVSPRCLPRRRSVRSEVLREASLLTGQSGAGRRHPGLGLPRPAPPRATR